jgi:hypothetical protein
MCRLSSTKHGDRAQLLLIDPHYDNYLVDRGYFLSIVFVFKRHAWCFFVGQPVDHLAEVRDSNEVDSRADSVVPHHVNGESETRQTFVSRERPIKVELISVGVVCLYIASPGVQHRRGLSSPLSLLLSFSRNCVSVSTTLSEERSG